MKDTGLPQQDAQSDFARQRRRRAYSKIASRLRFEPDDVSMMLPFEEVVAALGRRSERDIGIQEIRLDAIVGTVGAPARRVRPQVPPDLARRALALGADRRPPAVAARRCRRSTCTGSASCTSSRTATIACRSPVRSATPTSRRTCARCAPRWARSRSCGCATCRSSSHERVFHERVPLPAEPRARIKLSDEWRYAQLGTLVEAWGLRASHARGQLLSREEIALAWFREEYEPVVEALSEARHRRAGHRDRALHADRDAAATCC